MKPDIYRVRPDSKFDKKGGENEYVVNFLLECVFAWMQIRKQSGLYEIEQRRASDAIRYAESLLKIITTDPRPVDARVKIKVDMVSILEMMVEQLVFFSEENKARSIDLLKENLKNYLK